MEKGEPEKSTGTKKRKEKHQEKKNEIPKSRGDKIKSGMGQKGHVHAKGRKGGHQVNRKKSAITVPGIWRVLKIKGFNQIRRRGNG